MDGLVGEINDRREWPKMTRSDLIRLVMGRAIKERPEWLLGPDEKLGATPGERCSAEALSRASTHGPPSGWDLRRRSGVSSSLGRSLPVQGG